MFHLRARSTSTFVTDILKKNGLNSFFFTIQTSANNPNFLSKLMKFFKSHTKSVILLSHDGHGVELYYNHTDASHVIFKCMQRINQNVIKHKNIRRERRLLGKRVSK